MRIDEAPMTAARKPTASIARLQRPPHRRWHRTGLAADIEWIAGDILGNVQQAAIASDAASRVRRQSLAIIEFATTVFIRGQRFRGNVDNYLIALSR